MRWGLPTSDALVSGCLRRVVEEAYDTECDLVS